MSGSNAFLRDTEEHYSEGEPFMNRVHVKVIENDDTIFEVLAVPNRRRILTMLCQSMLSVAEMADQLGLAPQTVRYHLSKLEEHQLIQDCKKRRSQNAFNVLETVYHATADVFQFCFGKLPITRPIVTNCLNKLTTLLRKIGCHLSTIEEHQISEMLYEVDENVDHVIDKIHAMVRENNGNGKPIDRSILANILMQQIFQEQEV